MKRLYPLLIAMLLAPAISQAEQRSVPGQAVRAEDGDTLLIHIEGREQRIQLSGIDAPEDVNNPKLQVDIKRSRLSKQDLLKLGRAATRQLNHLLQAQAPFVLHYDPHKRDRYGRIPGDIVNANGASIAAQMVDQGYAVVSHRGTPPELIKRLSALQKEALRQQRGLWGIYPDNSRRWAGINANTTK